MLLLGVVHDEAGPSVGQRDPARGLEHARLLSAADQLGADEAELIGGAQKSRVLKASGGVTLPDGGAGLVVDDAEKQDAVQRFLKG